MGKVNVARNLIHKNLSEHIIHERDEVLATIDESVTNLGIIFIHIVSNIKCVFNFINFKLNQNERKQSTKLTRSLLF